MNVEDLTEDYIKDNYITVEEAAKYLRCSKIHLRKLLKEGHIPYLNKGVSKRKSIWINKQEIANFINRGGVQQ